MPDNFSKRNKLIAKTGEKLKEISSRPHFFYKLSSVALMLVLVLPFAIFFINIFRQAGGFSLDAFQDAFGSRTSYHLMGQTLCLALGTATVAMLVGLPLGFFFSATRFPLRRLFLTAIVLPLAIPSYLWALGWEMILGRQGYLEGLLWEGISNASSSFLLSNAGSIFIFGIYFSGLAVLSVILFLKLGLGNFVAENQEPWWKNFLNFLSVYRKSFLSWFTLFVIGVMMFREFAGCSLLGRETLTTEIYSFFSTFYNFDAVAAPGIIIFVFAIVLWVIWEWVFKSKVLSLAGKSFTGKTAVLEPGGWKTSVFWGLLFAVTAFYFFPVWIFFIKAEGVKFLWDAIQLGGGSILRSVMFSLIASVVLVAFVLIVDRFLRLSRTLYSSFVEKSFALIFFLPGISTGVLLNRFWNHRWSVWIYTTFAIVLLGIVTQYLYPLLFGKRYFEESSEISDQETAPKTGVKALFKKILNIVQDPKLLGLAMVGLVLSLRELGSTILLYPPGQETVLIKIFTSKPVETEPVISALVVFFLILISIPYTIAAIQFGRRR
ncbi:MAG: iron ABC transporter permease [Candidatus Omnitrophica bacterium]|nr:iron ABC transporter permease [Candidatus Omnitrophota bacterium]